MAKKVEPGPVIDVDAPPTPQVVDERLAKWFKDVPAPTREKLVQLFSILAKFNKAINLVSPGTLKSADQIHIADSVMASRIIQKNLVAGEKVYDVGSGNGFPGLVFAILYPQVPVVLVDRDARKCEYLKAAAAELKLSNVSVDTRSLEDLAESVMVNVVARGFAPLGKAMLTLRKPVKTGGRVFHLKSDSFANELAKVPSQLFAVWAPSLIGQYRLPDSSLDLAIVLTQKIGV